MILPHKKFKSSGAYEITLNPFPVHLAFAIGELSIEKELRRLTGSARATHSILSGIHEDSEAYVLKLSDTNGRAFLFIGMRTDLTAEDPVQTVGILAHESVHVWDWLNDYVGGTKECTEMNAYHIQSIVETLVNIYKKELEQNAK